MEGIVASRDGVPVHYEVRGQGTPALVFVHGWSCDRSYWRGQVDAFAARHQVVTVDLAGHGASGAGRSAWTMPAFGDDVVAVVAELGLGDLVLIGHSMGGDVIVETALRLPGQALGLVWVDTYSTLGEPQPREEIQALVAPFREDFPTATRAFVRRLFGPDGDPGLLEWVAADMAAAPPEVALDAMEHAVGNDARIRPLLERLTVPVVAINRVSRSADAEALGRYGVKLVTMAGVGHFLMLEDPATFNRLLGEVVAGFTGARS
jgi:pimeloyl-ACP methyl ester carboxylesterase